MNHKKVAQDILSAIGEDNLIAAAHCATRLRLVLKDSSLVDQKALDEHDDIKGTFETNGQFQIIIEFAGEKTHYFNGGMIARRRTVRM